MSQQTKKEPLPRLRHYNGGFIDFNRTANGGIRYDIYMTRTNVEEKIWMDGGNYQGQSIKELTKDYEVSLPWQQRGNVCPDCKTVRMVIEKDVFLVCPQCGGRTYA